jgi:alkylation response protein AidB-like acyl-CoA dehydrogenase
MGSLSHFRQEARTWLEANATRRAASTSDDVGISESDSVALLPTVTAEQDRTHMEALREWIQRKADAGFANLSWEVQWGGRGLPNAYERVFAEEESHFLVPPRHAALAVTQNLVAPTIRAVGTSEQKERHLRRMLRAEDVWCQLFSEPGAGSDLAGIATRAVRDGDEWVINGQKVWTSGANYAAWGYIQCRTDPTVPKHRGLTAFVVPMSAPGVTVRPLRQMTGGSSFNEVFFTDVRVGDDARLGPLGEGWKVAVTTLGFERGATGDDGGLAAVQRLIALARHLGRSDDALIRQVLARAWMHQKLLELTRARVKDKLRTGETPGPEASISKLFWTDGHRLINEVAAALLGPKLVADTGEWGTYAWSEHLLGAPGYRVAGGTDEVQRNIISERVLGLPLEPRTDRDLPFKDVPR